MVKRSPSARRRCGALWAGRASGARKFLPRAVRAEGCLPAALQGPVGRSGPNRAPKLLHGEGAASQPRELSGEGFDLPWKGP